MLMTKSESFSYRSALATRCGIDSLCSWESAQTPLLLMSVQKIVADRCSGGYKLLKQMRDLPMYIRDMPGGLGTSLFSPLCNHGFEIVLCGLKTKAKGRVRLFTLMDSMIPSPYSPSPAPSSYFLFMRYRLISTHRWKVLVLGNSLLRQTQKNGT